ITSGLLAGDVLAFTNTDPAKYGNIAPSYDATHGVLTLTSLGATATLAQWQAALDAVQYFSTSTNPTNFGTDSSRTISWVVNDGARDSAAQTTTLSITAQDAAPVLSNVAATASYSGVDSNPASSTPVTLSSALQVSDVDNLTLASAKVSITSGLLAGDVLAFTNTDPAKYGNIAPSYDATHGVLTLTSLGATATLAQWQAALDAVQYFSTSTNPTHSGTASSRAFSGVVNDGARDSPAQTTTLSITAQDAAPVLSNVAATASYSVVDSTPASSTPVLFLPAFLAIYVDNLTLASAKVSI